MKKQLLLHRYNENQKKGVYEILKIGKNNSPSEKKLLNQLREYFSKCYELDNCGKVLIFDGLVKEIEMDTCGSVYRFHWVKLRKTGLGEYYFSKYYGKRMYIDFCNEIEKPKYIIQ